jgi:hypothetical protein
MSQVLPSGTATILQNTSSITVTHTLGYAPDVTKIFLQAASDLGSTYFLPCTNPTATTFDINLSGIVMADSLVRWLINQYPTVSIPPTSLYCTAAFVKQLAQLVYRQLTFADDTAYDSFLNLTLIPAAMKIIDTYSGHNFLNNSGTITIDGLGKNTVFVKPQYSPLISLSSVTVDGVAKVVGDFKIYDDFVVYDNGIFTKDTQNVIMVATYGYTSVPSDVSFTCASMCAGVLREMLRSKMVPDLITPVLEAGGGAVGALLASPRVFTSEMKSLLNKYATVQVGVG